VGLVPYPHKVIFVVFVFETTVHLGNISVSRLSIYKGGHCLQCSILVSDAHPRIYFIISPVSVNAKPDKYDYGRWMQYSVFQCDLTPTQYAKLRSRLSKLIKPKEDRFYFLCVCCQSKLERIGGEIPMDTKRVFCLMLPVAYRCEK
jgi:CRISPR-associated protein Cas2